MHNTRLASKWQFMVIENFFTKLFMWNTFIIITSIICQRVSKFCRFPFSRKVKTNNGFDLRMKTWLYDDWSFWWLYRLWTYSRFWYTKNTHNTATCQKFFFKNMHLWLRKWRYKMLVYPCTLIIFLNAGNEVFFQKWRKECFDAWKCLFVLESTVLYCLQVKKSSAATSFQRLYRSCQI